MKRKRYVPPVCMALLCLLFTSCADSKNPLSDPREAEADPRLAGVWRAKEAGVTYYHVGRLGKKFPEGMMGVVVVSRSKDGKLEMDPARTLIFPTTSGDSNYLNAAVVDEEKWKSLRESGWKQGIVDGYLILKYQVKGDTLALHTMDGAAKKRAIKAGAIKGRIDEDTATITDTTENLFRFVTAGDDKLFSEKATPLERVK